MEGNAEESEVRDAEGEANVSLQKAFWPMQ